MNVFTDCQRPHRRIDLSKISEAPATPDQGMLVLLFRQHAAAPEGTDGSVEHLKTLCCLALKPESAMIAVAPVLHEFVWTPWALLGQAAGWAPLSAAKKIWPFWPRNLPII